MLILVFDTETTGLPDWKTPSEGEHQPHLVELACLLIDTDTLQVRDAFDCIIRPDGWTWTQDDEAFKAHGITVEEAQAKGIPEAEALAQFLALHAKCDLRVAHNKTFDERLIRIAIKRYGHGTGAGTLEAHDVIADAFKAAPSYCTMINSRPILRLPLPDGKRGQKNPRLEEAHQHFFGRPLEGAHRAMTDADACARVYFALNQPASPVPVRFWPPELATTADAGVHTNAQMAAAASSAVNFSAPTRANDDAEPTNTTEA